MLLINRRCRRMVYRKDITACTHAQGRLPVGAGAALHRTWPQRNEYHSTLLILRTYKANSPSSAVICIHPTTSTRPSGTHLTAIASYLLPKLHIIQTNHAHLHPHPLSPPHHPQLRQRTTRILLPNNPPPKSPRTRRRIRNRWLNWLHSKLLWSQFSIRRRYLCRSYKNNFKYFQKLL